MYMNIVKTRERAIEGDLRWDIEKLEIFKDEEVWIPPCPKCGLVPAEDCGYSTYDPYNGEHDCNAPDVDGEPCEYCHHLHCSLCKLKEAYDFKEEEFCIE